MQVGIKWRHRKWGHFSCSLRLYYNSSSDSPSVAHKLKCVIKLFLSHMLSCRSCFDTVAASWAQTQNEEDSSTIHIRHARRKIAFVSRTRITAAICVLFTAAQLVSTSFTPSLIQHDKERKELKIQSIQFRVALTFVDLRWAHFSTSFRGFLYMLLSTRCAHFCTSLTYFYIALYFALHFALVYCNCNPFCCSH